MNLQYICMIIFFLCVCGLYSFHWRHVNESSLPCRQALLIDIGLRFITEQ